MNTLKRSSAPIRIAVAAFVLATVAGPLGAWPTNTVYVAGTQDEAWPYIHYLDADLNDLGSFLAGSPDPNGMATDGTTVWSGHPSSSMVIAYGPDGTELFRWGSDLSGLQGMTYISPTELAIANGAEIRIHHPVTGTFVRSIPSVNEFYTEGLAWDGQWLWQLSLMEIAKTDITDGTVVATIPNAAWNAGYIGRSLTANAPGELTIGSVTFAGDPGLWWKVSSATGAVRAQGSNGMCQYGLTAVIPEPMTAVILLGGSMVLSMGRRRRRR